MPNLPALTVIVVLLSAIVTLFFIFSALHHRKVKTCLRRILSVNDHTRKEAARILGVDSIAATGVSLFDVLYCTSRFDPFTLKGIEHLHHAQHFDNLGDLPGYMKSNIARSEPESTEWRRMIHKYKGYTGEEQASDNLTRSGASIQVPESRTNPDYDAIVNGQHVDFAITDNPDYIQVKPDSDPNVFVWTNREMAHAFNDNSRVIVDPDLSSQDAFSATEDTFLGINDIGDYMAHIPVMTLLLSVTRNTVGVIKGNKDVTTALEHTAPDTVGVGFGGFFGSKTGLALGLTLAPVTAGTSAFIIPGITTLIGSIIGIFTGRGLTNWFKRRHLRSALEDLTFISESFQHTCIERFERITSGVESIYTAHKRRYHSARKKAQRWFKRVFFPGPLVKFYSMAIPRLSSDWYKTHNFYLEIRRKITEVEAKQGGLLLFAQGSAILNDDPVLLRIFKNEVEKKKLK